MSILHIAMLLMALAFLGYGISCIASDKMRLEFHRFGLGKWRILTGILQIAGAIGMGIGIVVPVLGVISAIGLALLMLLGFATRLRIGDTLVQSLPALVLMLFNIYLCYRNISFL